MPLNYRMTVSGRSDFYAITQFPEVYHGQGISKAAISAAGHQVTRQGRDTIYRREISLISGTCCVSLPLRASEVREDPGLRVFGSPEQDIHDLCKSYKETRETQQMEYRWF